MTYIARNDEQTPKNAYCRKKLPISLHMVNCFNQKLKKYFSLSTFVVLILVFWLSSIYSWLTTYLGYNALGLISEYCLKWEYACEHHTHSLFSIPSLTLSLVIRLFFVVGIYILNVWVWASSSYNKIMLGNIHRIIIYPHIYIILFSLGRETSLVCTLLHFIEYLMLLFAASVVVVVDFFVISFDDLDFFFLQRSALQFRHSCDICAIQFFSRPLFLLKCFDIRACVTYIAYAYSHISVTKTHISLWYVFSTPFYSIL